MQCRIRLTAQRTVDAVNSAFRPVILECAQPGGNNALSTAFNHLNPTLRSIIMNKPKIIRPLLLLALLAVVVIGALALLLANGHSAGFHDGSLMMFDEDLSDSALGWAIAIPILLVTAVLVVMVLAGTGVLVAGVLAVVLVATLLIMVLATVMAILPLLAFVAVPILAMVGLVKLLSRPAIPTHAVAR